MLDKERGFAVNISSIGPQNTFRQVGRNTGLEIKDASGMAIDSKGNVIISDCAQGLVLKFDVNGEFALQIGASYSFSCAFKLAVDSKDNVYVVDLNHTTIAKFDSEGNFLLSWGNGSNPQFHSLLHSPYAISIDSNDRVFVLDRKRFLSQRRAFFNPFFQTDQKVKFRFSVQMERF